MQKLGNDSVANFCVTRRERAKDRYSETGSVKEAGALRGEN